MMDWVSFLCGVPVGMILVHSWIVLAIRRSNDAYARARDIYIAAMKAKREAGLPDYGIPISEEGQ